MALPRLFTPSPRLLAALLAGLAGTASLLLPGPVPGPLATAAAAAAEPAAVLPGREDAPTGAATFRENDYRPFGLLAIQDNGRRKPLDTFARESLLKLTGATRYRDRRGRTWSADAFAFSLLTGEPRDWEQEPLILVKYHPLAAQLGLDAERTRFSFAQLAALPGLPPLVAEAQRLNQQKATLSRAQQEALRIGERLTLFTNLARGNAFALVPPPPAGAAAEGAPAAAPRGAWLPLADAAGVYGEARFAPVTQALRAMVGASMSADPFQFALQGRALHEALRDLGPRLYPTDAALNLEYTYNHLGAFSRAAWCYGLGLLLLACGALPSRLAKPLRWAGALTAAAGLAFHAAGLVLRCLVAGRPPVTNMFESLVWVAFVVTVLGFAFFARYRGLTYLLSALPVSCLTMMLVLQAPVAFPPTIDPLVPVLRDNFWLTVHVLTITASYGAFALGMGFGHLLLFRYLVNPETARRESTLHLWLYRVLQLGVLLITAGTILGGVWANYSWGRFWGWDPKETWALITLLCYIVALHGRIAGYWGQFGLAVASVVNFAAVVMAWYGVNYVLGKGLHSYGFGVGGEQYVAGVIGLDLAFLGAVLWRRHRHESQRGRSSSPASASATAGAGGVGRSPGGLVSARAGGAGGDEASAAAAVGASPAR